MADGPGRATRCRLLQVRIRCGRDLSTGNPGGGGLIVKLKTGEAEFRVSSGEPEPLHAVTCEIVGGGSVRMILTVADPETVFAKALAAGATQIYPVGEQHGWRLGRLVDPMGLHWEIGHQLGG